MSARNSVEVSHGRGGVYYGFCLSPFSFEDESQTTRTSTNTPFAGAGNISEDTTPYATLPPFPHQPHIHVQTN